MTWSEIVYERNRIANSLFVEEHIAQKRAEELANAGCKIIDIEER